MTDHSALIERLKAAPDFGTYADEPDKAVCLIYSSDAKEAAAGLRDQQDRREGIEEDLFQAVSVAYHRGAVEWARRNYPQWFAWIEEGRACLPSAPNQAKEAGE